MSEFVKNARREFEEKVGLSPVRPKLKVLQSRPEPEDSDPLDLDRNAAYAVPSSTSSRVAQETPAVVPPPVVGTGGARQASVTSVTGATYRRPTAAKTAVGQALPLPLDDPIAQLIGKLRFLFGAKPAATVEQRRCHSCGETMTSSRYRRSLLRFVRIYRCGHCRRIMEQESRGYQGFYLGAFLTLMAPFLINSLSAAVVALPEIAMLSLVTLLGLWPTATNFGRYMKAPVLVRASGQALLPKDSGRSFFGRILGGESRLYGLLTGIALGVVLYTSVALFGLIMTRF